MFDIRYAIRRNLSLRRLCLESNDDYQYADNQGEYLIPDRRKAQKQKDDGPDAEHDEKLSF